MTPHRRPLRCAFVALAAAGLAACASSPTSRAAQAPAPPADEAPAPVASEWVGTVNLAGDIDVPGSPLPFVVRLELDAQPPHGTLDIPAQSARDVPVSARVDGPRLSFSPPDLGASWELERAPSGNLVCRFVQGALTLPCTVQRIGDAERVARLTPPRPQTPAPPYPYAVRDVTYDNAAAGVHLAGTLTQPEGPGPFPAVLLITGSGDQDRDETLFDHKPFLVLADHLARHGIAALRVDDRGVGGSSSTGPATLHDFATDVEAGVAFLKAQPGIDPARVGLLGHSEGALIAPLVASRDRSVAFVVALAAPGVPGSELLVAQVGAVLRSLGAPDEAIAKAVEQQRAAVTVLATEPDPGKARARLLEVLGAGGEKQIDAALTPWFRALVAYDPRPALEKLRCPVLALYGALDTQVPAEQNAPELEKALKKAKNRRATVRSLDGLNHLFQPARTGAPTEYPEISTTLAPEVLSLATDWIHAQVDTAKRNTP